MKVIAERPQAPSGYGYATGPKGMLSWDEVGGAIAGAKIYWIGTTRPDGSSHLHPIWGGRVGEHLYFEGGDTTRWARNLSADARVSFGVEFNGLHISGRGTAAPGPAGEDFDALTANYASKYDYTPQTDSFYVVTPEVIIALNMSSMESFAASPTKFRFEA